MNRCPLLGLDRPHVVHRLAQTFSTRPSVCLPTGMVMGAAGIKCLHAAHQSICRFHRDRTDPAFAYMLRYFGRDIDLRRAHRSLRS